MVTQGARPPKTSIFDTFSCFLLRFLILLDSSPCCQPSTKTVAAAHIDTEIQQATHPLRVGGSAPHINPPHPVGGAVACSRRVHNPHASTLTSCLNVRFSMIRGPAPGAAPSQNGSVFASEKRPNFRPQKKSNFPPKWVPIGTPLGTPNQQLWSKMPPQSALWPPSQNCVKIHRFFDSPNP